MALFKLLTETQRPALAFTLDGQPATGLLGDTLLTAMLTCADQSSKVSRQPRSADRISITSGSPRRSGPCASSSNGPFSASAARTTWSSSSRYANLIGRPDG